MKLYVPDVRQGVKFAMSYCVQDVPECGVPSVSAYVVNRVLMMVYAKTVKKKGKMKMKKNKSQEKKKKEPEASLKQTTQRSSSQAKSNETKRLALRFSPTAWAKLLYFRDTSDNEVGGFGISNVDDLLFVKEFITVKQEVTPVSVKFDDEAVADLFDTQVDLGRKPEQFGRIWLHSHPGNSPEPSIIDDETFTRVFGNCQWSVMFILAQDNKTYAKLSFNVGPGGQVLIPVEIEYRYDFGPTDKETWDAEYTANVNATNFTSCVSKANHTSVNTDLSSYALPYDFLEEFESMCPEERQFILDELAERPELWNQESEEILL